MREWIGAGTTAVVLGGIGAALLVMSGTGTAPKLANTPAVKPVPVPTIAKPTAPNVACVDVDTEPFADGIVCFTDGCLRYEAGKQPAIVARPARMRWPAEAEVRDDKGHLAVCTAAGCLALGPKLAAAITSARTDNENSVNADPRPGPLIVEATSDRSTVMLANARLVPEYWNVAGDKPITFVPPKAFKRDPKTRVLTASPIGTRIAVMWEVCPRRDGDFGCADIPAPVRTTIADATGRDLDGEHDAFSTIYQVGKDRFVLDGDESLQLVVNGKVTSRVPFTSSPTGAIVAEAGGGKLVALVQSVPDRWRLVSIDTADKLAITELAQLPDCH